ncbi:MAG: hypothetical protein GY938_11390 [Ketobacter sp.]|nr:hypothetical protein [Ketobacter sp.]
MSTQAQISGYSAEETVKRIVVWSVPRSASTLLERTFLQRQDTKVFHEPYSEAFYFGLDRCSNRYAKQSPDPKISFATVTQELLANHHDKKLVFIKDMAYYVADKIDTSVLDKFTNTFIIRDPMECIPSLYRMSQKLFEAGFDPQEIGYHQLWKLYEIVFKELEQPAIIVDSTDLRQKPKELLEAYCTAIGIAFEEKMLHWEPREVPVWDKWEEWHTEAQNNDRFYPPPNPKTQPAPPDHLMPLIDECQPIYQALYSKRLLV